ncbi:ATP12 family protein [Sphingomonas arenae]|uniref:ATP12 family protein n=1 Tax=Sphingomonas arenae TaxID=2812555 RepID=UPI001966DFF0
MKRFWKQAAAVESSGEWRIELDGRPVRTPARALLVVRQRAIADAIAAEWQGAGDTVDARAMPMTGLANAAIDRIAPDIESFAAGLAKYGEGDLLTYRADGPQVLVDRQAELWDPLLTWARRSFDIDFVVTTGVTFVSQPDATVSRLAHAVRSLEPFSLAGLSPLVTVGGSLVAALAVAEQAISPEEAWTAVSVDEAWQLEKWGSDAEAEIALENRRLDFLAGARFLELLRS